MHFVHCSFLFQIAFESELMFGCRIEENEQKLKRFLEVASQVLKFTEPSYVSLDTYLRPRFAKHALMATVSRAHSLYWLLLKASELKHCQSSFQQKFEKRIQR